MKTTSTSSGQPHPRLGNSLKLLCAAALLAGAASAARASDPTGIYAFVDRVVFEPSDTAPERIQVWGGFALAKTENRDDYHHAERGYLYFKLRPGDEEICKKEWADLKSVAGTGQMVAFGSRPENKAITLRKADAKAEKPDAYPKGWGMNKLKPRDYAPLNQLANLQGKKTDAKEPPKTPGK
jgi:hypothetical protein